MRISLLFDRETLHPDCQVGWGFSCYIHEAKILFDTGEDPHKLQQNLQALDIPVSEIHRVVLSHGHFDHIRGVRALREVLPEILVAPGLLDPAFHKTLLNQGFILSTGNGSGPILPGIQRFVVAQQGIVEQALTIRGEQGWCFLFGCAHWGVDRWIQAIRSRLAGPIDLVMGGYHLIEVRPARIREVIEKFLGMGIKRVAPCHCTGPKACNLFREAYGDGFVDLRVGEQVEV